jgi:hypothetical protein
MWAKTGQKDQKKMNYWPKRRSVWIYNKKGHWAGVILLQTYFDFKVLETSLLDVLPFDLVAISRGCIPHESMEEYMVEVDCEHFRSTGDLYEFYNVLRVEWENGVAFRKGLGRIERSIWENQLLETIDLVLG